MTFRHVRNGVTKRLLRRPPPNFLPSTRKEQNIISIIIVIIFINIVITVNNIISINIIVISLIIINIFIKTINIIINNNNNINNSINKIINIIMIKIIMWWDPDSSLMNISEKLKHFKQKLFI